MDCYQRGYPVSPIQDTGMIPGWGDLSSTVWFPSAKHDRLGGPLVWFFMLYPGIRNSAHSSCPNLMQRQNTFPVLALSYLHMTQEGGHDLDIHGSLMASSRSAGALTQVQVNKLMNHCLSVQILHEIFSKTNRFTSLYAKLLREKKNLEPNSWFE